MGILMVEAVFLLASKFSLPQARQYQPSNLIHSCSIICERNKPIVIVLPVSQGHYGTLLPVSQGRYGTLLPVSQDRYGTLLPVSQGRY